MLDQVAQSIQHDYLAAAKQHRLLKEIGHNRSYSKAVIKGGLALTTLVLAFVVISHLAIF